eukprot:m.181047 g.181047  ORF g.181047 m.181047 type:complete len:89 (-) comp16624_c2_seq3:1462-1728(-)
MPYYSSLCCLLLHLLLVLVLLFVVVIVVVALSYPFALSHSIQRRRKVPPQAEGLQLRPLMVQPKVDIGRFDFAPTTTTHSLSIAFSRW